MNQPDQDTKNPTSENLTSVDKLEIPEINEADLTPVERDHWRLREQIVEGQITLNIKPNKAMKWMIERTFGNNLLVKALLIFNYFQWIILLPGFVALYYFDWYIGLAVLAGCLLVAILVLDKVKRKVMLGGVREYVIKDVASLEGLYSIGAVRFRKGPKGKWISYPHDWQEVLLNIRGKGESDCHDSLAK